IEREQENLIQERLLSFAEEFAAAGTRCADVAWNRQAAAVKESVAEPGQNEERPLAEDGHIALQFVLIKWIPPPPLHIWVLTTRAVAVPIWHGDEPPVRLRMENLIGGRERLRWRWCSSRRGIRALQCFGIFSRDWLSRNWWGGRLHLGQFREARGRRGGCRERRELDIADQDFAGLEVQAGFEKYLVTFAHDFQFVRAGRQIEMPEDALGVGQFLLMCLRLKIAQNHAGPDDGSTSRVAHNALERTLLLWHLPGNP